MTRPDYRLELRVDGWYWEWPNGVSWGPFATKDAAGIDAESAIAEIPSWMGDF